VKLPQVVSGFEFYWGMGDIRQMILCECGEFIDGCTFKDYIKTTANPSTPTVGHAKCGLIFNFIDDDAPKRYSSKTELKSLAIKFAEKNRIGNGLVGKFLLEVDRLKSDGTRCDMEILIIAYKKIEPEMQSLI
jgi:hypothetical protein